MKIIGVIPARYGSTRFPGKPLATICGKTLIERVFDQVKKALPSKSIYIATEDPRIYDYCRKFCDNVMMTSVNCPSGTDRVAEVAKKAVCDIVINIQGDEPLVSPGTIKKLVKEMQSDPKILMATPIRKFSNLSEIRTNNSAKVIIDKNKFALVFSRYLKPETIEAPVYKHIGIYAYRKQFLLQLVKLRVSPLEKFEKLEQLRVLENGYKIKTVLVDSDSVSVDVPEDIYKVERILQESEKF